MELHLALRNIVKTDGPAIITEGRLVNILCDFQAFDAIPASKYVMRAIIDDGYAKKLLQCTKWDINAQQLSGQFSSSTGFQADIVHTIFESLAYGLGWINGLSPQHINRNTTNYSDSRPHNIKEDSTEEEYVEYFNSIVERKPFAEERMEIEILSISFTFNKKSHYSIPQATCFIETQGLIKKGNYLKIIVVYFDKNGKPIYRGHATGPTHDGKMTYFVGEVPTLGDFPIPFYEVSKIVVYPE